MFTNHSRSVKSITLLAGSFTFAFLFAEMMHEFGHYLGHIAYGNPGIRIHLDPFGSSHIKGANNLSAQILGITSAAGPLFNLTLGLVSFALLLRKNPFFFFLFFCGGLLP